MKRILIVCSILAIGLASCVVSSNNPFDALVAQEIGVGNVGSGIASKEMNEPCEFPCFLGIRPGLTTESELDTIIQIQSSLFKSCEEVKYPESQSKGLICTYAAFSFDDTIVNGVSFDLGKNITVQDFIDYLGEPTRVATWETSRPDQPRVPGMVDLCFENAFTVLSYAAEGEKYNIQPGDFPETITFVSVQRYHIGCNSNKQFHDWKGYGEYIVNRY